MARVTASAQVDAAPTASVEDVVAEIGPRLRALRAELGLSLQQMSAIAEVSAASIHKIERGEMVPTITTLLKLATAFRRPISHLINEQPGDPNDVWHTPRGAGEALETESGAEVLQISGPAVRFRSQATTIRLPAGAVDGEPSTRPGEALLYVLGGTVEARVGERVFTLRKGDSFHYLTDRPVTWTNTGRAAAELLRISIPQS
jgi:transcriptional regulator with XRE-family HTH domain